MKKSPLARSRKPLKRVRVKPVNAKRRAKNQARAYGPALRREFMASLPCLIDNEHCAGRIHQHHIKTGGTGRKADYRFIVGLCAFHHRRIHTMGRASFEHQYGVDLQAAADARETAWETYYAEAGSTWEAQ